jgi:[ribosomal protein S5]-alanine N-acetyltransferase
VLRPIATEVAAAVLAGRAPGDLVFAAGYPSRFSLETLRIAAARGSGTEGLGPYFMVRKVDGAVVGEIGASLDAATGTAHVGYTVVEPSWGRGYATQALRALLAHLRTDPRVRRVVAETLVDHHASRRVMEKAGMRPCGRRVGEVDGRPQTLVAYEAEPPPAGTG